MAASGEAVVVCCSAIFLVLLSYTTLHVTAAPLSEPNAVLDDNIEVTNLQTDEGSKENPSGTQSKHSFQHETDIIKRTQRQYPQNLATNPGNSREKRDLSGDLKHVAPQKAPERKFQREYEDNSRRLYDWEARQYPGQRDYYRNKLGSRGQYVGRGPNLPPRGGYPGGNAYQEPRENTQDIIPPQRWEDPEKEQAELDSNNFLHGKVEMPPADVKPLAESAPKVREGAKIYTPERVGVPRQVAGFWDDTPDGAPDKTDTERSLLETLAKADRQKFHRIGFGPQKVSTQYDVGKGRVQQEYGRRQGERYPAQQQERYPGPYDRPAYGNNRDNRPPSRYQQDRREHFRAPMEPANLQGSFHSPFSNFEKKEENAPLNGMNFVLPHEIQDVVPKPHRQAAAAPAAPAAAVTTPKEQPVTDPPTDSDQDDSEANEGETNQEDKWDVPMPPKSKAWLAEHPEEQEVRSRVKQPLKTTHSPSTEPPPTTKPPIPMPPKSKKWLEEQRLKKEMEELSEEKAELGRLEEEAREVEGNGEGQPGTDRDEPSAEGGPSEQGRNTVEKPSNKTSPSVSKVDRQAELEKGNEEMFEEFENQEKSRNDTKPSLSQAERQAELERENEEMLRESEQEEEDQWPTETENDANRQPVYEDPRESVAETNFMVNQTSQRGSNQAASSDQYVDDDDGEIEGEEVNDGDSDTSQGEVDMDNSSSVQDFDNVHYERQREENRSSVAQQPEQGNGENREGVNSQKVKETKAGLDDFAKMWAEANKGRRRRKRAVSEGQRRHGGDQEERGAAGKRAEGVGSDSKGAGKVGAGKDQVGKEEGGAEGAGKEGTGKDPSGGGGVGAQGVAPTNDVLVNGKKIPMPARRGNAVLKPAEKVVASPMREIQPERLGVPKKAAGFWEDTPQGDDGKGGEVSKGQGHMKVTLNKGRAGQKVESSKSRSSSRSRSSSSRRVSGEVQRARQASSSVVKPSPFDSVGGRSPFDKIEEEGHKEAPVVPHRDPPGVPPPPQPKDKPEDQKQVSNRQITSVNQELEEVKVPLERPKSVLHNAPASAPKNLKKARPAPQDQERRVVEVERRLPEMAPDVPGLRDNPVRSAYRTRTGEVRGLKEHQAPSEYKTQLGDDVASVKETPVYKAFSGVKSQVEFSGRKSPVEYPVPSSHRVTESGPVTHDDTNTSEPAGNDTDVSYQIFNTGFYATIMKRYKSKDAFWGALCLATLLFITFSAVWYSKMWRKRDGDWDFASTYKPPISIPIRELLRQKLGKISHLKVKLKRKKKGPASRTGRAGHRYLQLTRKQTSANTPTSSEEEVTYKRL